MTVVTASAINREATSKDVQLYIVKQTKSPLNIFPIPFEISRARFVV